MRGVGLTINMMEMLAFASPSADGVKQNVIQRNFMAFRDLSRLRNSICLPTPE